MNAANIITDYIDPVIVERMPDYMRESHMAAGNWGSYPHNGAERVILERADFDSDDEYDHIVREAAPSDFDKYKAE